MVYTVALNPSIDYMVEVNELTAGEIVHIKAEDLVFGGEGTNVFSILVQLGMKSCALGFIAGLTGDTLEQGVVTTGVQSDFLKVEQGFMKTSVEAHAQGEGRINGQRPQIRYTHLEQLTKKLDRLKKDDILVLSGDVPGSIPQDIYADIMQHLRGNGIHAHVNVRQESLMSTLVYHSFLIKPNHKELTEVFGVELSSGGDLPVYVKELQAMGARDVLVSMAEQGALLLTETQEVYRAPVCRRKVVNSVGASNSMVAGFLYSYLHGQSYAAVLHYGITCGSASAFSKGIVDRETAEELLIQLEEREVRQGQRDTNPEIQEKEIRTLQESVAYKRPWHIYRTAWQSA